MKPEYALIIYDGTDKPKIGDEELLRVLIYSFPDCPEKWSAVVKSRRCDLPTFTSIGSSLTKTIEHALSAFYTAAGASDETGS